jgi:hypothetical protein
MVGYAGFGGHDKPLSPDTSTAEALPSGHTGTEPGLHLFRGFALREHLAVEILESGRHGPGPAGMRKYRSKMPPPQPLRTLAVPCHVTD